MVHATPRAALILLTLLPASLAAAPQVKLLDFSLATCGPCRQMDPVVARLEAEGFHVDRIDGGRSPQIAAKYGVNQYPTFVVVANGREVKRVVGITPYQALRNMLVAAAPRPAAPAGRTVPAGRQATFVASAPQPTAVLQAASNNAPPIDVPGANPTVKAPAPSASADTLLNATVRLTVKDASGQSFGTGTIVDARSGEALVLTCAHLFRGADKRPIDNPAAVTVEFYQASGGQPRVVESAPLYSILSCNFENDVALVCVRPTGQLSPARIAANANGLRQGDPVLSSGCDHGADPTVRTGVVNAINRYQGWGNVCASGAPAVGRSGGGLFNARGEVVGVCNNADYQDDEGIYASLAEVHAELDRLQLSAIYRGGPLPTLAADDRPAPPTQPAAPAAFLADQEPMAPLADATVRAQGRDSTDTIAGLSPSERAAMQEIVQHASESEVVCVIRPKSGQGRSQVVTLENVSPEFVRALLAAYHSQPSKVGAPL